MLDAVEGRRNEPTLNAAQTDRENWVGREWTGGKRRKRKMSKYRWIEKNRGCAVDVGEGG